MKLGGKEKVIEAWNNPERRPASSCSAIRLNPHIMELGDKEEVIGTRNMPERWPVSSCYQAKLRTRIMEIKTSKRQQKCFGTEIWKLDNGSWTLRLDQARNRLRPLKFQKDVKIGLHVIRIDYDPGGIDYLHGEL